MVRRILQIGIALFAMNALLGGGLYLVQGLQAFLTTGGELTIDSTNPDWQALDFFIRALAAIWFSIGLMFAYMIPNIEKHTIWFRFSCTAIFLMGIGRLFSIAAFGIANNPLISIYLELSLPLLLIWGQHVVTKNLNESAA